MGLEWMMISGNGYEYKGSHENQNLSLEVHQIVSVNEVLHQRTMPVNCLCPLYGLESETLDQYERAVEQNGKFKYWSGQMG